jgi:hypothetical protein
MHIFSFKIPCCLLAKGIGFQKRGLFFEVVIAPFGILNPVGLVIGKSPFKVILIVPRNSFHATP